MRIAVFSDVHGNAAALDAVLDDIAVRGVDATVGLGDFLSGAFDPVGVADRLIEMQVPVVSGNHDRWLHEGREKDWPADKLVRAMLSERHFKWLRSMPATQVVDGDVFMCHGTPVSDNTEWMDLFGTDGPRPASREYIEAAGAGFDHAVLLCGHTHVPRTVRLADGRLLLNPGSVGLQFVRGTTDAHYAIIERRKGAWSAQLIAIPYDRSRAQQQALAHGFPAFAKAVETGWARLSDFQS
ncbi:MAG TPA: metallophosphoesterase family protein [Devosia sp.]|nr:metallophosphoesterase family protein [Devosia sp.]